MVLIRWRGREWDPFQELFDLQKNISNIFDTSFETLPAKISREATWLPSLDVSEDKDNLTIKMDVPGVKQQETSLRRR